MYLELESVQSENFESKALEVFEYQRFSNPIYAQYCQSMLRSEVKRIQDIPFLPISLFKTHKISCSPSESEYYFESSGTSGQLNARHYYVNLEHYHRSIELGYRHFFGDKKYTIVGLLPHYLERQHSSLVAMVRHWMSMQHQEDLFYLHDLEAVKVKLNDLMAQGKEVLLIGISFALQDLSEIYTLSDSRLLIIETGGMKGLRAEIPKSELIRQLKSSFPQSKIISEYGMCELFSQAYSDENLWFSCPPWMRVLVGDVNDPLSTSKQGRGAAKVIDLANIESCSFIETQDLIELKSDHRFQLLGRMDQADMRGCSLMYS